MFACHNGAQRVSERRVFALLGPISCVQLFTIEMQCCVKFALQLFQANPLTNLNIYSHVRFVLQPPTTDDETSRHYSIVGCLSQVTEPPRQSFKKTILLRSESEVTLSFAVDRCSTRRMQMLLLVLLGDAAIEQPSWS